MSPAPNTICHLPGPQLINCLIAFGQMSTSPKEISEQSTKVDGASFGDGKPPAKGDM